MKTLQEVDHAVLREKLRQAVATAERGAQRAQTLAEATREPSLVTLAGAIREDFLGLAETLAGARARVPAPEGVQS